MNFKYVPLSRGLTWKELVMELKGQIGKDHLMAYAGNLAFRSFLAIFPLFLLLLSLLGLFNATGLVANFLDQVKTVLPPDALSLLRNQLLGITKSRSSGAFGIGALVSIALALWGLSGMIRTIMESLNVMYGVDEGRGFVKKYALSIGLALGQAVLFLIAIGLVAMGPTLTDLVFGSLGIGEIGKWIWVIARIPILIAVVLFALSMLYYLAPDVEQKFKFVTPGSIIATVIWLLFTVAFTIYVGNFGSYNATYGTFGGIVVLLLYALYSSFIILVGAEVNQIVEAHAPDGKDPGEKIEGDGKVAADDTVDGTNSGEEREDSLSADQVKENLNGKLNTTKGPCRRKRLWRRLRHPLKGNG